jgi:ACS family hexuronate transporter-like MFS transporter
VCLLLMQASIINYMDRLALNQLATEIQAAFGLDDVQYSWLESAFSFAFAFGALGTGFVVDRVSVRWVYPLMVVGWSFAGILTGFAGSFWMLLTCRFLLGLFEAGNWPCAIRTLGTIMPPAERSFGNSLFGSGTALGAVVTPMLVLVVLRWGSANGYTEAWRLPFQVIGSLGLVWVALWFLTVPAGILEPTGAAGAAHAHQSAGRYTNVHRGVVRFTDVFRDRRFWVLVVITMCVNFTWHGYRAWLPLYLRKQRGYTLEEMSAFTTVYYLVADVGTWTAGLATLVLCKRGVGLHASRVIVFACCAALALGTVAIPFLPDGWPLHVGLLAVAFGALGLFPNYFALSQEVSSRHQGKVTGTLGAFAHLSLAAMYPLEGWICKKTRSYEWVLGGVGIFPLIALCVILLVWREPTPLPPPPPEEDGNHS